MGPNVEIMNDGTLIVRTRHFDDVKRVMLERGTECRIFYEEESKNEWISPKDKLPKDRTPVLTVIRIPSREPHVRAGYYYNNYFMLDNGDVWNSTDEEVLAWMPLPEVL